MKFLTSIIFVLMTSALAAAPGFGLTPPPTEHSQAALFRTYDRNRDGKITLQEYLDLNACRDQACRDYLTRQFRNLDANGDGVITLDEFLAPLRRKGKK